MRGYPSCPAASARRLTTPCEENARISCGCHGFEALSSLPQTLTELLGVGSVVHNYVGGPVSDEKVLALFDRLATDYPHWNRTYASGPVRHLLISPCDHGPGDCMYDRKPRDDGFLDDRPGAVVRWQDVDFRSAKRRVAMLTLNGSRTRQLFSAETRSPPPRLRQPPVQRVLRHGTLFAVIAQTRTPHIAPFLAVVHARRAANERRRKAAATIAARTSPLPSLFCWPRVQRRRTR